MRTLIVTHYFPPETGAPQARLSALAAAWAAGGDDVTVLTGMPNHPTGVVPPEYRGQGVARALLKGAVAYAKRHGATLVEAYPVDKPARSNDDSMWFGAKSMYDSAGFKEVARRKPQRPIVRLKPV